jgi:uncharacterized protein (TIGR02266 family)
MQEVIMKNKGKKSQDERRQYSRIPITAKVKRVSEGQNDFYFTKDLSVGGIFLATSEPIPVGTILDLEISIHGLKNLLKIKGRVTRVEKKDGHIEGVGVQFVEMDEMISKELEEVISKSG